MWRGSTKDDTGAYVGMRLFRDGKLVEVPLGLSLEQPKAFKRMVWGSDTLTKSHSQLDFGRASSLGVRFEWQDATGKWYTVPLEKSNSGFQMGVVSNRTTGQILNVLWYPIMSIIKALELTTYTEPLDGFSKFLGLAEPWR
ncbi:hypothetical protein B0I35DRAFT_474176 [Stachybotrys elegans]|uniref:Uncharacterized protein n=1 Tax=Stachybotrys elegans TaxID=80388 RepID=A0A8K0T7N3_9HYPO|nr:hypothetical protein B0I35DRAFT_474176 [Stachybotrys elegans]